MVKINQLSTAFRYIYRDIHGLKIVSDVWKKSKYDESIYFGKTYFKNLNFKQQNYTPLYDSAKYYFLNSGILNNNYNNSSNSIIQNIWLTNDYFLNGKFDNPICAHWNPRLGIVEIHPGLQRCGVLNLFSNDKTIIDIYYFSTYGVKPSWIHNFKKLNYEYFKNEKKHKHISFGFIADHGTFIPNINDQGEWISHKKKFKSNVDFYTDIWYNKCKEILKNKTIYVNKDVEFLHLFKKVDDKSSADKIITIKSCLTKENLIKLCILVFLDYNFENEQFKIKINKGTPKELKISY